jgi:hypothetical protein
MMQSAVYFGFICLLKIKDMLRISDFVCVGLFKYYPKNNTAPSRWFLVFFFCKRCSGVMER